MIRTQLKEMKEKVGLTNKQLSELSNVPLSTVSKIMSGQTDIPNFQTVCDLVIAMGGSLDALAGISKDDEENPNVASNAAMDLYVKQLAEKDRWLKRLFIICCILSSLLIGVLIFDLVKA